MRLTLCEKLAWLMVYAVGWYQNTTGAPGVVTDHDRAMRASREATRAVRALRGVESDDAAEVLG